MYDGYPVNVSLVSNKVFHLSPVHPESDFKEIDIDPRDLKFDVSTPPLGWINSRYDGFDTAFYVERLNVRKWRQGLCNTNTQSSVIWNGKCQKFTSANMLWTKGFEDMVMGSYPTLENAFKTLKNKSTIQGIAVSRNIAIAKRDDVYTVWYKKDEVGFIPVGSKVVRVPHEQHSKLISKFLKELTWEIE